MPRLSVSAERELQVVLDEQRETVVQVRPGFRLAAATLARHLIEQEVGERRSAERAAVAKQAEQPVVASVEPLLDVVQELPAALDGVTALEPGQLLVDLIRLVERVGVGRSGAHRREPIAPPDRAQTGNRLTAGDPEGRIGIADPAPVECVPHDGDLVVAEQHLVDERRRDDSIPVEGQVAERRLL